MTADDSPQSANGSPRPMTVICQSESAALYFTGECEMVRCYLPLPEPLGLPDGWMRPRLRPLTPQEGLRLARETGRPDWFAEQIVSLRFMQVSVTVLAPPLPLLVAMDVRTDDNCDLHKFLEYVEPKLRRALCASLGVEVGRAAACEALVYGYLNWARVARLDNPVGYLYRVGRNSARFETRRREVPMDHLPEPVEYEATWIEPSLSGALGRLTSRQRAAVVLRYGFGWTLEEIAEVQGVRVSSVRNHVARAMVKLRSSMVGSEQKG